MIPSILALRRLASSPAWRILLRACPGSLGSPPALSARHAPICIRCEIL